jgi:hypothetical protein
VCPTAAPHRLTIGQHEPADEPTYTVSAPDPFVAAFPNFLLDRTAKKPQDEPLNYRKDEYPAAWAIACPARLLRRSHDEDLASRTMHPLCADSGASYRLRSRGSREWVDEC